MREVRLEDRLAGFGAYSYRDDAGVPAFDDSRPLVVFDGACVLCSGFARHVLRQDAAGRFLLTATQMSLGAALMRHYGLDPDNPETNHLVRKAARMASSTG